MTGFAARALMTALALALAGCATWNRYAPSAALMGADRAAVVAELGPVAREVRSGTGTRLLFARGPMGHHTYAVDLDAQGRVSAMTQVLTEARFAQVTAGVPRETVLDQLGPPSQRSGLARNRGHVDAYRYENSQCLWFQIEYAADSTVRSAGYGTPPECERIEWEPIP